jgi:hypothetical protein
VKAAAPQSEYVLLRHFARDKGLPVQSLRDAAARREFDVLELGKPNSMRPHLYARRADLAAWEQRRLIRKDTHQIQAA